jgi:hypothetical protein
VRAIGKQSSQSIVDTAPSNHQKVLGMSDSRDISAPQPPDGFATWLDFAVETFDTRGPWIERLFSDDQTVPALDRDAIREAARAELRRLRVATGTMK